MKIMINTILFFLLIFCIVHPVFAGNMLKDKLQKIMYYYTEKGYLPGITITLIQGNNTPINLQSGIDNIQTNTHLQSNQLFEVGSVTKTFTAVAAMKVFENFHIPLNATIEKISNTFHNDYSNKLKELERIQPKIKKIKVINLMNHTSGIYDEQSTLDYMQIILKNRYKKTSLYDHVRRALLHPPYFKRGKGFHYANSNYIFLGLVLEAIVNRPFRYIIQKLAIKPSYLTNLYYYYNTRYSLCSRLADAYTITTLGSLAIFRNKKVIRNFRKSYYNYINVKCDYNPVWDDGPAGGMMATVKSLAVWSKKLFSGKIISIKLLNLMLGKSKQATLVPAYHTLESNIYFPSNEKIYYGLGIWKMVLSGNIKIWRILGEQWGYQAGVIFIPKQKYIKHQIIIAYGTNTDNGYVDGKGKNNSLIQSILEATLQQNLRR